MAGTRLALIAIYSIQIITLFTFSFYQTIEKSYSNDQSPWSRIHQPFKTDRRGLSYLNSRFTTNSGSDNTGGDLYSVLTQISVESIDMDRVEFYIINHHHETGQDASKKEEEDRILHEALQLGLDQHLMSESSTKRVDPSSPTSDKISSSHASVKSLPLDDYSTIRTMSCNDVNLQNMPEPECIKDKDSHQSFIYQIHFVFDCEQGIENDEDVQRARVKMEINEFGNMIIRFPKSVSIEEMKQIIQHPVSKYLATSLLPSPSTTNLLSFSSMDIVSTLVDSNPHSAGKNGFGPMDHNHLLSTTFRNQMDKSIALLALTVAPLYKSTNLELHGATFVGQDVAARSFYNKYDDEDTPNDYILSLDDAMDIIWNGEIGNAIGLLDSSAYGYDNELGLQEDKTIWNLIFYVPPASLTPLFFQSSTDADANDNSIPSWSQAFATSSKNTIVSVVNISHGQYSDNQPEPEREPLYLSAIQESISYAGSYMRKRFGLPSIPYNAMGAQAYIHDQGGKIFVEHHYTTPASFGIAPWEVDSLLRKSWSLKLEKAIRIIESILDLVHSRNMVAFPFKLAQRLEECVQHLKDATNKENTIPISARFDKLNLALEEAKRLAADEEMLELPFVSYDQLFAIFGSLIFPLLAPMIKNVSSEISRFRILSKKLKIG